MDEYQAPEPIEVSSFHFSQLRTLRLAKENERVPTDCINIVAAASKYGLLFIGLENGFKVLKLENILDLDEDKENKSIEENYYCHVVSSETPSLMALSSDQKTLAVCVTRNGSAIVDMYDIAAFADPEKTPLPFQNVLLSNNGSKLKEFAWNPAIVEIYAFCMSDGSLSVHELSGTSLKIIASLPNAAANAACWSPKGKQIVVGKSDGSFSQYKPNLQEVKNIPPPKLGEKLSVENICWVSTAQFVVLYVPEGKSVSPYLFIVTTPKGNAITYTNFYDLCLGNGTSDDQRYFLHFEPQWGIIVCASTDSIEVAVVGNSPNWVQWDVKEDGKALLPGKDGATHAIGMGVMYCAQRNIVISEYESYPPMPIIFFLTNNGLLVSFHMVNIAPGIDNLVRPSTPIDVEGERKRPGGIQNVVNTAMKSQNVTQASTSAPTASMQSSVFQPPIQESKNANNFVSPSPSNFGFAQVSNVISSEPPSLPQQQQQQQFISDRKSAGIVTPPSVLPVPAPLIGNSSLTSTQLKRTQNSLNQPSFSVSTTVATNIVKPTPLQQSSSGNMINKEEFEKQNTFKTAIIEEIQTFEKELLDLKSSSGHFVSIGTKEEMATLKSATLNFEEFQNEMKKTMSSLNTDIHDLKNVLLESFVMVEEANSRNRRKNDHMYISLLKERALCPMTAKRMKNIEQNYIYLNTQIQELSNKLDQDWYEYLEKKKANQKAVSNFSSAEAIYKTLVNNQNIIHNLKKNLEYVTAKASEKRLENISRYKNKTQFLKKFEPEDLSKLADTFLQTKLTSAEEEKSPKSKKISSDAQAILKNYFSTAAVNTVRPTVVCSPSGSRLISKSVLYKEISQKTDSQAIEQLSPSIPSLPNDTMTKLFNSVTSVIESTEKKNAPASKFTLPSSPSPKVVSSSSVSSSGGPLYEDITPPGSPGPVSYPPETIAVLRHLIAQGHTDEQTLNTLLGTAMRYNHSDQNIEQSPTHSCCNHVHYPHPVPFKDYSNPKENSELKQPSFNNHFFNSATSNFGLKNILNQPDSLFGAKTAADTTSSAIVTVGQQSAFKQSDFIINKTNKNTVEKSSTFSFSQSLIGTTKGNVNEGSNFLNATQSRNSQQVPCDITTSTSVLATNVKQNEQTPPLMTKSDIQSNKSSTKLSFFPTEGKTLSFFEQPKTNTNFNFNTKLEAVTSSTVLHGDTCPSTSSSTSLQSNKSSDVNASVNFNFLATQQSTLAQSSNILSNKEQDVISNSEYAEIPFSKTSEIPLTNNTNSFSTEVKSSTNSLSVEKPLFGTKASSNNQNSITSSSSSFLFNQLTSPKSETAPTASFDLVKSTESKAGNTSITSTPSFFGRIPTSEPNSMTGTTSFLFGPKAVSSESQTKEVIASENAETEQNSSSKQETVFTSSPTEIPTDTNLAEQHNTVTPPSITTSNSSMKPSVIPVSDQQAINLKATTVSSNFSETPNISTIPSLFGSSVTSVPSSTTDNSSLTSPPSTTVTNLFGQNNGNTSSTSFFTSPPNTQSSFFNSTNNQQKSFFGKTTAETATTQSSFFTKPPLESASTAPSFFGKATTETSTFGQNTFAQTSPFGAALSSTTATSPTGSFFSQSTGGQGSVFGGSTSENSGFLGQNNGSFSFGKSPFGETQSSFGLAKSVFGQTSTFGQPASPQTNTGFGQQTGISAFGQGSFFSGLGGKPSEENASKNVFAMGGLGKESSESSVFGSSGATAFGAKTGGFTAGSFSSGGGSVAQSGFGAFQQQSPQKPGGFGTAPAFGGAPSFGSPPAFGSPPSFGSGNALGSVFGSSQQSSNFSNFASANSPTFGSLASQTPGFGNTQQSGFGQQQSAFGSPSVFGGGSTFGGSAPSFGSPSGGQSNSSAFTQWRN